MSIWITLVSLLTVIACSDRQVSEPPRPSEMETAIARDLTARFGTSVTARCLLAGAVPVKCSAKLGDGTALPIAIENASKTEWGWRVDGRVIETKAIAAYVQEGLADVHVTETASCGAPIQVIKPGERIVCKLSGGGAAFVDIAADGSTSLELALDSVSAAARMELVTPDSERELTKQSKALEPLAGESDGEGPMADAGVADAAMR